MPRKLVLSAALSLFLLPALCWAGKPDYYVMNSLRVNATGKTFQRYECRAVSKGALLYFKTVSDKVYVKTAKGDAWAPATTKDVRKLVAAVKKLNPTENRNGLIHYLQTQVLGSNGI
jgi:hypothetical protein